MRSIEQSWRELENSVLYQNELIVTGLFKNETELKIE